MTKNVTISFYLFYFLLGVSPISSCKKLEKLMAVSTGEATTILTNSAEVSGEVIDIGEGIIQHGHCYGKTPDVTVSSSKSELGSLGGTTTFSSHLTSLEPETKYYIKAYVSNGTEIKYGKEISFITRSLSVPLLTTSAPSSITPTSAICGGNITSDGGASVSTRGLCWSTTPGPTINNNKTSEGTGSGSFTSNISNLTPETTYYIRAYASNSIGTAYGNELSFTTAAISIPHLSTVEITSITKTSASSGGNITSDGGATVTTRGVCYSTNQNPTIADTKTTNGNGTGAYTSNLTGLTAGTTYYVRAYATNNIGTAYGNELSLTTSLGDPITAPGNISATPGDKEVTIKWDAVPEATGYNIYWSTSADISVSNFTAKISDVTATSYLQFELSSGTTYYYVVTAKDATREGSASSVAKATTFMLFKTNNMSTSGEKHYYQVTVSSGQNLFVTLNIENRYQSYNLYVKYGSVPTGTVYDAISQTGHDEAISITNTQSGTYYIMVFAKTYTSSVSGNYSITCSTSAIALTLGTIYEATIVHAEEKHHYELSVSDGQNLFVTLNRATSDQYFLYIKYGSLPSGTVYDARSETGHDESVNITNTKSGTYYIMVYANTYNSAGSGIYNIKGSLW